jgi:hypothetical protein
LLLGPCWEEEDLFMCRKEAGKTGEKLGKVKIN